MMKLRLRQSSTPPDRCRRFHLPAFGDWSRWGIGFGLLALISCSSGSDADKTGPGGISLSACRSCAKDECQSQANTCDKTAGCNELIDCSLKCSSSSSTSCATDCVKNKDSQAVLAVANYLACATLECTSECVPNAPSLGGNSGLGGAPSFSGSSGGGRSSSTTGGSSTGSTGTTTTGGAAPKLLSGQNQIEIEDGWADPAAGANGLLHVSGVLYGYGDGCATYTFETRGSYSCISGTLCEPGSTGSNWGVGIGFDFNNTGDQGSPPNSKKPWDATAVDAIGFSWYLDGNAPGLQVWVTNMDPKWNGLCTAADCGIAGPPDGRGNPARSGIDSLEFATMEKDYWGGSGVGYTFNPKNILSLQFKLSATKAGAVPFDFCVVGINVTRP